jgi:hypothetical protein
VKPLSTRARNILAVLLWNYSWPAKPHSEPPAPIVATFTERDLLMLPNCGSKTVEEIASWLSSHGLALRINDAPPDPAAAAAASLLRGSSKSALYQAVLLSEIVVSAYGIWCNDESPRPAWSKAYPLPQWVLRAMSKNRVRLLTCTADEYLDNYKDGFGP